MSPDDLERLRQLFGGYFHQDWSLDASAAEGVIDRFVTDHADGQFLSSLADLVDAYAESKGDGRELQRALASELWCEYNPNAAAVGARDWLHHVACRLRLAATGS